jgi:hypothetical protein
VNGFRTESTWSERGLHILEAFQKDILCLHINLKVHIERNDGQSWLTRLLARVRQWFSFNEAVQGDVSKIVGVAILKEASEGGGLIQGFERACSTFFTFGPSVANSKLVDEEERRVYCYIRAAHHGMHREYRTHIDG